MSWQQRICHYCMKNIEYGKEHREMKRQRRKFHPECFLCSNCNAALEPNDDGKIRDCRLYCKFCYTKRFRPECQVCKLAIAEGDGLATLGKSFHVLCFRCAGCRCQIVAGKRFMINDEIYCRETCYRERLDRERTAAAGSNVSGGVKADQTDDDSIAVETKPTLTNSGGESH